MFLVSCRPRQFFPACENLQVCYATGAMNISEAITPFLNHCHAERHVADSTLAKYRECFDCWLSRCLEGQALEDISRLDVLGLRQAMTDQHLSIARQYSV